MGYVSVNWATLLLTVRYIYVIWLISVHWLYLLLMAVSALYGCIYVTWLYIIIVIIIESQQCKAGRERFTQYQSKDPSPTIPPIERTKRKGKTAEDKK